MTGSFGDFQPFPASSNGGFAAATSPASGCYHVK